MNNLQAEGSTSLQPLSLSLALARARARAHAGESSFITKMTTVSIIYPSMHDIINVSCDTDKHIHTYIHSFITLTLDNSRKDIIDPSQVPSKYQDFVQPISHHQIPR